MSLKHLKKVINPAGASPSDHTVIFCIACRSNKSTVGMAYGSVYAGPQYQTVPVIKEINTRELKPFEQDPDATLQAMEIQRVAYPGREHGSICQDCQSDYGMIYDFLGSHRRVQIETSINSQKIIDDPMNHTSREDFNDLLKSSQLIPRFHKPPLNKTTLKVSQEISKKWRKLI